LNPGREIAGVPIRVRCLLPIVGQLGDRGDKKPIYERIEVLEYVLVDSTTPLLERCWLDSGRFDSGCRVLTAEVFESKALPGFGFRVSELFERI